ncbi:hypothetical protein LLEC1_08051, partial [Akanthomyces lecanii]
MTLKGPASRRQLLEQYPFAEYAATYWSKFASKVESCSDEVVESVKRYYSAAAHEAFTIGYHISKPDHPHTNYGSETVAPLYYASFSGLLNSVKMLRIDTDINKKQGYYGCALLAAVARKHLAIAKELLSRGANVNVEYRRTKPPLSTAVANNDIAMIQLLIEHHADVNFTGGDDLGPL